MHLLNYYLTPMDYLMLFTFTCCFTFLLCYFLRNRDGLPTNWPIFGMLPAVFVNLARVNDFVTDLTNNPKRTFYLKGPLFTNIKLLLTADPTTVHHVMSKNSGNYPKGSKYNDILDVLGDGIFNADASMWQYHRGMAQSFIGHPGFQSFLVKKVWEKIQNGLIPVLNHVSKQGLEVDLQDLFERFTFDNICGIVMDYDPKSLSIDLPPLPPSKALDVVEKVIFYRHILPRYIWKFQRWLGVGLENKYREAWNILDEFVYECISRKRDEMSKSTPLPKGKGELDVDLITLYMGESDQVITDKFLRDTVLNFFIAGRDTTSASLSWFFYLLSQNPHVLSKIKDEITSVIDHDKQEGIDDDDLSKKFEQLNKLVYLHAALCEALRLYPPVPFLSKSPKQSEVLPSGYCVDPTMQILFNLYSMARIKSIWGDDCYEFKPERWISNKGEIKHEPSSKFLSFNSGPRTCVGKNMAFIQMKAIVTTIIQNYDIQMVEGQRIVSDVSIILHMKYGLKVKVLQI